MQAGEELVGWETGQRMPQTGESGGMQEDGRGWEWQQVRRDWERHTGQGSDQILDGRGGLRMTGYGHGGIS